MEEDLTGDIVGIIADEEEGLPLREDPIEGERQEVSLDEPVALQLGEGLPQVLHGLPVQLDDDGVPIDREEVLRQHTHTGPHLQDRQIPTGDQYLSDTLCHGLVVEEMLSEGFLGPYALYHAISRSDQR